MDLGLAGMRAIVTGGSRGIGRAAVAVLADEGCAVALCARAEDGVEEAVAALRSRGRDAYGEALDVADAARLEAWVASSAEALGGIDIVVANVSSLGAGEGEESWRNAFAVDLMHTVRVVEAALPHLRESDAAAVVIVSSVAAREAGPFEGAYATMKAALNRYGRGLAQLHAAEGIRANVVSPGTIYIEGGFWYDVERADPAMFRRALKENPMGRMGSAEEVARAIAFLASPAASFVTGTNLLVDGALTKGLQN
jgi:NAD(P)-dependent dehydrogenase (short-subunit alcohol dehydrogenase family)